MTSPYSNLTLDETYDEINFTDVLIESLDDKASDYQARLAHLSAQRAALKQRQAELEAAQATDSRPRSQQSDENDMDSVYNRFLTRHIPASSTSPPGRSFPAPPSGDMSAPSGSMKRSRPESSYLDAHNHASKRPTPDHSNVGTPFSSDGSFEMVERDPGSSDPTRRRQLLAEAAARRQHEATRRDADFARQLSQQQYQPAPSSSRSNVQTTLDFNGGYQRPRPQMKQENASPSSRSSQPHVSAYQEAAPRIKPEPSAFQRPQQLAQRPRQPTTVVDLTGSDEEDEVAEIAPEKFTPNSRPRWAPPQTQQPVRHQMPGTFPGANPFGPPQNIYGQHDTPAANPLMNGGNGFQQIASSIRNGLQNLDDPLRELNNYVNGRRNQPWNLDADDDDIVYQGARPLPSGLANYAGREDLYHDRYNDFANYDPSRSAEEIQNLLANIRPDEDMPAHLRVQTPEALTIRLHKYQESGLTWLKAQEEGSNRGGILADDMGLGKTIQMLSLMVTRKSDDPRCKTTLIVAPLALLRQWKQEIRNKLKPGRHALSVFIHHGATKAKSFDQLRQYDVVLTTYGSLASEVKKVENFRLRQHNYPGVQPSAQEKTVFLADNAKWYRVILDEAQCIKNRNTQTSRGACMLKATYRFCVTGTPMMNNVEELYSHIKFLGIKPYCNWEPFRRHFSTPLKSNSEDHRNRAMQALQALLKAILLRRTKKSKFEGQPILVLPERTTEVDKPVFSEDEKAFYTALETQSALQFNKYLRKGTVGQSYTAILVLLLRLRQACCHPHLIKDFDVAAAADMTEDQLVDFAKELDGPVIERIKATGGNFECPVCYDAVPNPAIFIPCGHDTCSECFAKIADPSNAIRAGEEGSSVRCPNCRGNIDPKRVTDFNSFKKIHMPEMLTEEERAALDDDDQDDDDSETESDADSESEEEDDDGDDLKDFIVDDDEEVPEDSDEETNDDDLDIKPAKAKKERQDVDIAEGVAGPSDLTSELRKGNPVKKAKAKSKKGKGKEPKQKKKKAKSTTTLADLKKAATRNKAAKKKYLRRLRKGYVSSAKIEKTMEILADIMAVKKGEKVLIFSQWTSLLDLLEIPIDEAGYGYRRYDGSMSATMRADAVDDFGGQPECRIMLISLKAGNAGLNLNMASQVIILDPFWNPYIEEQAIDRAHRIGQNNPVKVHRVLIEETVEDRIIALQEKKRALISEALDEKSAANIGRLGVQELAYLFGVTHDPSQNINYVPRQRAR